MVEQFTPKRGPLFGSKPKVHIQREVQQRYAPKPGLTPLPKQSVPKQESFLAKNKLLIGGGIIVVCLVFIAVVLIIAGIYSQEVTEKTALMIPFLFRKKE